MSEVIPTKKHIITIAGQLGSGKSTTAKAVAAKLGYGHASSGNLFREIAKQHGLTILQAGELAERDRSIDDEVDQELKTIGATRDGMVLDSHMGWHFIPQSFKVFLDLDMSVAAARRINNGASKGHGGVEEVPTDPVKYAKNLLKRRTSEILRYKQLYNANPYDVGNYDLVIDTNTKGVEEVVAVVIAGFRHWIGE